MAAGQEIKHGQDLRLTQGYYPFMIESTMSKLPPVGKIKVGMIPMFVEREDPIAEPEKWRAKIRPLKHRLEAATESENGKFVFGRAISKRAT